MRLFSPIFLLLLSSNFSFANAVVINKDLTNTRAMVEITNAMFAPVQISYESFIDSSSTKRPVTTSYCIVPKTKGVTSCQGNQLRQESVTVSIPATQRFLLFCEEFTCPKNLKVIYKNISYKINDCCVQTITESGVISHQ